MYTLAFIVSLFSLSAVLIICNCLFFSHKLDKQFLNIYTGQGINEAMHKTKMFTAVSLICVGLCKCEGIL